MALGVPREKVYSEPFTGVMRFGARGGFDAGNIDLGTQGAGVAVCDPHGSESVPDAVEAGRVAHVPIHGDPVRNRPRYERHGFEEIGAIQAADSPWVWPMLRPPAAHRCRPIAR